MSEMNMRFTRGIVIGMIAGAAVGAAMMPRKRSGRHYTGKALRAAGGVIDQISDILGV